MPKEDYLIKFLEKLGRVIAAMLGFRKRNMPEESIRMADEICKELFSMDITELLAMNEEAFISYMRKENYSASYLEPLAQMMHEAGKAFGQKGDSSHEILSYKKSLHLYMLLNEKDKTFSFERENIISTLKSTIEKNN